jgi:Coenzyme PQQ synthesis protein D (PqqD)
MSDTREIHELQLAHGAAVWREIDGETVVLALESSTYLSLNATGSLLWHRLTAGTARAELIDVLVDHFEVERGIAAADVDTFIADCRRRGLLP